MVKTTVNLVKVSKVAKAKSEDLPDNPLLSETCLSPKCCTKDIGEQTAGINGKLQQLLNLSILSTPNFRSASKLCFGKRHHKRLVV